MCCWRFLANVLGVCMYVVPRYGYSGCRNVMRGLQIWLSLWLSGPTRVFLSQRKVPWSEHQQDDRIFTKPWESPGLLTSGEERMRLGCRTQVRWGLVHCWPAKQGPEACLPRIVLGILRGRTCTNPVWLIPVRFASLHYECQDLVEAHSKMPLFLPL